MNFFYFLLLSIIFSQDVFNGYTLFTPYGILNEDRYSYLIDNNYNIINTWEHQCSCSPASMPYLVSGNGPGFEHSLLYYPARADNIVINNGAGGGIVLIYNWEGDLIWNFANNEIICNETYQAHHDIEVLPNGNFLVNLYEVIDGDEAYSMGRISLNNPINQIWSVAIFEIEPNFETGYGSIIWEWHLWDHLIQDVNPELLNYGDISNHPELFNINFGPGGSMGAPGLAAHADWIHANAIAYNDQLDQIVISFRDSNEIIIIDHSTTTEEAASHEGGISERGGDILYRWGNPPVYQRGNNNDHHHS